MAKKKKKTKRRRTTSEKVIIVLGIIITISMILGMVAGLGGSRQADGSSALPEEGGAPIAMVAEDAGYGSLSTSIDAEAAFFPS